jgi:hypothetical protein
MATDSPLIHDGSHTTAAADLSAATNQFRAVKLTAAQAVNLASTGGEAIYGILQNTPASGQPADVGIFGISKALIGVGGVTAGDTLQTETATGKLITKSSTNTVVGIALTTNAAGELCTIKVIPTAG